MTPFVWAQTADARPLVPALHLKPPRQHLTCCLEPLTSMMIAPHFIQQTFKSARPLWIALHLHLLTSL